MPFYPKSKKSFKAKSKAYPYKKRNEKKNVVPKTIVSLGQGFPKKMMATLKYKDYTNLSSSTGVMGQYLFSCNNLNDPNWSGGGGQALYYDQLMSVYNHYTVIGSKIKISVLNAGSVGSVPLVCGVFINDDTQTNVTTYQGLGEQVNAKMKVLGSSTTDPAVVITNSWSAKKHFGGSVLANNVLRGALGASPAEQMYYNIFVQSIDSTSTVGVYILVEVEYVAIFTELKEIARS